jgi:hypothetical protein
MSHHPSKEVINLYATSESAGSDIEEIVQWDKELRNTKTIMKAVIILSSRKFSSPNLESQHKILLNFINQPAHDYFRRNSTQAKDF